MFKARRGTVNSAPGSKSTIGHFMTTLEHLWLPPYCCLCGFAADRSSRIDLCEHCRSALPWQAEPVAGRALPGHPGVACVVAPLRYAYPADHMIRALKFRNHGVYARALGTLIASARAGCEPSRPLPDVVLPIPLHVERLRERGFNQAQEIARYAARALGVTLDVRTLERTRSTAEQSLLSGEARARNVEGAFRMRRPLRPVRAALVDDVLTTGSTLAAAIRALRAGGIEQVEIWVAARARGRAAQPRNTSSSATPMKIPMPT